MNHSQRHLVVPAALGFGNNGSLAELHRCLAWYDRHPNLATKGRGPARVAALKRDIAALESTETTLNANQQIPILCPL